MVWLAVLISGICLWVWVWSEWKHLKETNQGTFTIPIEKWGLLLVGGLVAMLVGLIGVARHLS